MASDTGAPSIRDVIAFPKTTTGQCLLTEAPADVSEAQLAELHIAKAGMMLRQMTRGCDVCWRTGNPHSLE